MATTGSGVAANVFDATKFRPDYFAVALGALAIAVLAAVFFRGFLGVIPILIGVIGGYALAAALGQIDYGGILSAPAFAVPDFILPRFDLGAVLVLVPISLVVITEHIGHLIVTSNVVGRDFVKDPGLHRSLAGDGIATSVAALMGGPPNTTYGENIGVMAVTRVFSVWVIGGAAVIAIGMSFFPMVGAVVRSIPVHVMGGICILLFGIIASAGVRMLVESKVDFSQKRNLIIASIILVIGIGGAKLHLGKTEIGEMALAAYVGMILNLVLPRKSEAPAEAKSAAAPAA
jgi:uracil permease